MDTTEQTIHEQLRLLRRYWRATEAAMRAPDGAEGLASATQRAANDIYDAITTILFGMGDVETAKTAAKALDQLRSAAHDQARAEMSLHAIDAVPYCAGDDLSAAVADARGALQRRLDAATAEQATAIRILIEAITTT